VYLRFHITLFLRIYGLGLLFLFEATVPYVSNKSGRRCYRV